MIPESFYVNVDIDYKQKTSLLGSVPMSVLCSNTASETKVYDSLLKVKNDYSDETSIEYKASKIYFENGGKQLLIFKEASDDTTTISNLLSAYTDFIWITFAEAKTVDEIKLIANELKESTQSLPKFLAQSIDTANAPTTLVDEGIDNVALLYNKTTVVPYSAIVIPAYFSGINLNFADTLKSIVHTKINKLTGVLEAQDITTTELTNLYNGNWNVVINLANKYTTLDGGKMVDGQPIHSAWGFAIFKKNCEDAILELLVENKLAYNNSSNAIIRNYLSDICNTFVSNGLIGTDKVYDNESQYHNYNGVEYETIRKGEVLNSGYHIFSIPIGMATTSDKNIGKIPPVYIYAIINDTIRLVTIIGEVTK